MKRWGIAVIGCGAVSEFHLNAIRGLDNAKLTGVASRREDRARETGERECCAWTTDYSELLRHPETDIVCLTTDSGSHYSIALDVLNAGKHLFVEKPIAMTTEQADRMILLAKEKGVTLSVVSQRRFEAQHRLVKRVVSEGKIGKLMLVEVSCPYFRSQAYYDSSAWRGKIAEDGGALMNQGIHSIDLMLWLGGPVQSVYGKTATLCHDMEAEDMGLAMLRFRNGAFGTIMSSTGIRPGFAPSLHLYGDKGTIKLEGTAITHWTVPDMEPPEMTDTSTGGGGASDPRSISMQYHKLQLVELLAALSEGREPEVTGTDGKRAVQLIEAIYDSSREGIEIQLEE
ncbi:Gfo/Idh/MocA family protein [Paenibacillus allorhizosphaerae]|uniref:Myo-inositol 2-dehydrogenase n=1 Tax=Paenibacillus allorhizosphaerae TaxID=2849866 RepID=A0ABM8VDW7_9BACL|nr:Gfo/Idh/MocA family oxidoreductase [Paenibacillus allorhizosphaerae]CAG7628906.1 Myo-inositol 2-dehydrogenase [Paenibacillus allorhizosphaerae]